MKVPPFMKTIRFRLTLWYSAFLILILVGLVIGVNAAMRGSAPRMPETPPFANDVPSWRQWIQDDRGRNLQNLRNYSLMGVGAVLVVGVVGGYFLSGTMLKPVERISSLAARISQRNLKERINHQGPSDELKYLADTFDEMLQRLDSAFESQKQFIQDASHELRTPIAIAQTNLEVVEMDERATTADYRHAMEVIKLSLERMTSVNEGLLLLSEGGPTQSGWSVVNMASIMDEVAMEERANAAASGISLQVEPPAHDVVVRGDAMRLKQAIINLVDNAIKYNRPGGMVKVSAQAGESDVIIQVQDNGIGISQTDQQRIFDRFYRVDKSRSRAHGGTGLGLAIAKKIAEDHKGSVSVESILSEGSTFRIVLPRHSPE